MVVETSLKLLSSAPPENLLVGAVLVSRPNFEAFRVEADIVDIFRMTEECLAVN